MCLFQLLPTSFKIYREGHTLVSCWQKHYGYTSLMSMAAHIQCHLPHSTLFMSTPLNHPYILTHNSEEQVFLVNKIYSLLKMSWLETHRHIQMGSREKGQNLTVYSLLMQHYLLISLISIYDERLTAVVCLQAGGDFLYGTSEGGWGRTPRADRYTHRWQQHINKGKAKPCNTGNRGNTLRRLIFLGDCSCLWIISGGKIYCLCSLIICLEPS